MIRVLLVDDHPVVRAGIRGMLAGEAGIAVVGEADGGARAVALARELQPDVVLMDLSMPDLDGAAATAAIVQLERAPRVLIFTTYDDDDDLQRAIDAGALGYLLKDCPRATLLQALAAAARGEAVLAPSVAARLVAASRRAAAPSVALSARELDVLSAAARGRSNKEIADDLGIGEATVKTHLLHCFGKLQVRDRTAAVVRAFALGLLARP